MHIEVTVALNFVTSFLYNRLPRRRVNDFAFELEKALKEKFVGHWYPEAPEKGSGFRCIKVGNRADPPDAILAKAAYDSGLAITDVIENLPAELTIWIDPAEVSYKIGDKDFVKLLYTEREDKLESNGEDKEVLRLFNPEARDFLPINFVKENAEKPNSPNSTSSSSSSSSTSSTCNTASMKPQRPGCSNDSSPILNIKFPATFKNGKTAGTVPPIVTPHGFSARSITPTFTTASFAQTKFGSTKLKTNGKRTNRMSPTEFSNYIKQRAQMQQMQQTLPVSPMSPTGRPISPPQLRSSFGAGDGNYFFGSGSFSASAYQGGHGHTHTTANSPTAGLTDSGSSELFSKFPSLTDESFASLFSTQNSKSSLSLSPIGTPSPPAIIGKPSSSSQENSFFENLNFAANSSVTSSYPLSPYQQLLLAN